MQVSSSPDGPVWMEDRAALRCSVPSCSTEFSLFRRRSHCRYCLKVVCGSCRAYAVEVPGRPVGQRLRVCRACADLMVFSRSLYIMRQTTVMKRKSIYVICFLQELFRCRRELFIGSEFVCVPIIQVDLVSACERAQQDLAALLIDRGAVVNQTMVCFEVYLYTELVHFFLSHAQQSRWSFAIS